MLQLRRLKKSFGTIKAVEVLDLDVQDGELCVLLGPSGCGKTTVLRLIAGLENPDGGTIFMGAQDWSRVPPQKRNVAMVFQHYALYPHRTVRGNIEYPLRVRGVPATERMQRVERITSLLGIAALLDRKPRQLSGGEAQRVALARALVREPICFLMDEPLSNLDPEVRVRARVEIKRLQRQLKVTTLYVTHDQEDAVALADRIAIMERGRLIQVGTPEELFRRPATSFVARCLGKPPMNLVQATIVAVEGGFATLGLETSNGTNPTVRILLGNPPGKARRLIVGFRPEHIELAENDCAKVGEESWLLCAETALIEGLEPDYVVHYDTPAGAVLVRATKKPPVGMIRLKLHAAKGHYFDAETGERLE